MLTVSPETVFRNRLGFKASWPENFNAHGFKVPQGKMKRFVALENFRMPALVDAEKKGPRPSRYLRMPSLPMTVL